jgi:steroid delta-isomerase-like uncharacterized protein
MVIDELTAAWNARDPKAVAAVYTEDGVRDEVAFTHRRLEGRSAIAAGVGEIMTAWPDCTLEARTRIANGDTEVLEWIFRGTSKAAFGPLPATGQAGELRGVSVCTVADGRIREERVYWDTATLMAAAGLLD